MNAANLKSILRTLGLTHAQAGALCGVSTQAVDQWCQGRRANPAAARLLWLMAHHQSNQESSYPLTIRMMLENYPKT